MDYPLPDGQYIIVSQASGYLVGRKMPEDFSLAPKGVFTLGPPEREAENVKYDWNYLWQIEQIHDGLYKLKVLGSPVGERDGLLWAFLTEHDQENAGEWRIRPVKQGNNAYLIDLYGKSIGWVTSAKDMPKDEQIKVKVGIVGPSEPPTYPKTEVFIIKPAKHEGEQ